MHRRKAVLWSVSGQAVSDRMKLEELWHMGGTCESCTYYIYDDDYESYVCDINMDEDEYVRLMSDSHYRCPYYRSGDEYAVVRKQC